MDSTFQSWLGSHQIAVEVGATTLVHTLLRKKAKPMTSKLRSEIHIIKEEIFKRVVDALDKGGCTIQATDLKIPKHCTKPPLELHVNVPDDSQGPDAWRTFIQEKVEGFPDTQWAGFGQISLLLQVNRG